MEGSNQEGFFLSKTKFLPNLRAGYVKHRINFRQLYKQQNIRAISVVYFPRNMEVSTVWNGADLEVEC